MMPDAATPQPELTETICGAGAVMLGVIDQTITPMAGAAALRPPAADIALERRLDTVEALLWIYAVWREALKNIADQRLTNAS